MNKYDTEEYWNSALKKNINAMVGKTIDGIFRRDEFIVLLFTDETSMMVWDEGGDLHASSSNEFVIPKNIPGATIYKMKNIVAPGRRDDGDRWSEDRKLNISTSVGILTIIFNQVYPYKQTDFLLKSNIEFKRDLRGYIRVG